MIDTGIVSEVKIGGDWHSVKYGTFQIGELNWVRDGDAQSDADELGFTFEVYGSQGEVVAGPIGAITSVRYHRHP